MLYLPPNFHNMNSAFSKDIELVTHLRTYVLEKIGFQDKGYAHNYTRKDLLGRSVALCQKCGLPDTLLTPESMETFLRNHYDNERSFQFSMGKEVAALLWLIEEGFADVSKVVLSEDKRKKATGGKRIEAGYFSWFKEVYTKSKKLTDDKPLSDPLFFLGNLEPVPPSFRDSYWYCYTLDQDNGAIDRHILHINSPINAKYCYCELSNVIEHYDSYTGIAAFDPATNHLILHLVTKSAGHKHLHIKIRLSIGVKEHSVLIGIDNIIGTKSSTVNSEVLVFEKTTSAGRAAKFTPRANGTYDSSLPIAISTFLHSVKYQQTIPTSIPNINSLGTLDQHNKQLSVKKSELMPYCQKYWLYLKFSKKAYDKHKRPIMSVFELELDVHEAFENYSASLKDYSPNGFDNYEQASVVHFKHFIIINFFDPKRAESIHLSIDIGHAYIPEDTECFTAIISGITDDAEHGAAFKALVVRQDAASSANFKRLDDPRLARYFEQDITYFITNDRLRDFRLDNL